ncbi:MAG: ribonuclease J [Candidatus Moranbacteria bacterium]|jgi:ribonuclease J|nr:ribonuclease J [Candidatus Moranbacteria bacterium]
MNKKPIKIGRTRKPIGKSLRIIPLGGLEEIGRNMTVFEYGDDIIIVDCGLMFPEEEMMGIDYIVPNIEYLKDKTKNIRGIIITHGHFDHIGAIPHLVPALGNPPIYATELTRAMILKRQEDYKGVAPLNVKTIRKIDRLSLGAFKVEFFHVNHSIPDAVGLVIRTPVGAIVHTGDFKFDHSPVGDVPADISKIARIGAEGILALMSDSTDSQVEGYSVSESKIRDELDKIFADSKGRIITATFASLVSRIQQVAELSEKHGRKLAVDGYSMKNNFEIARQLGYINAKKSTFIDIKEVNNYPDSRVAIMCTGAQGEGNAVLMRIVNGEHRYVQIHHGDTVLFSSSVIPGNERTVQGLMDTLYKKGAEVINYKMMDIHSGGHARAEDLKMMINLIRPQYLIPVHGTYYMLKIHGKLGEAVGLKPENILIGQNGRIIEFDYRGNGKITNEQVPSSYVMVDGLGVGDVGNVVLRDRQLLAKDGMFTIITIVDKKKKEVVGEPQITSRGFIYVKENFDLVNATKKQVKKIIGQSTSSDAEPNWDYIKNNIRDEVGRFLFQKTQRRPMILPVIIEV